MRLPTYDPEAKCPKCGNDEVATVHYAKGEYVGFSYVAKHFKTSYPPEHLWRTCKRCRFGWPEKPIDKVRQDSQEPDAAIVADCVSDGSLESTQEAK